MDTALRAQKKDHPVLRQSENGVIEAIHFFYILRHIVPQYSWKVEVRDILSKRRFIWVVISLKTTALDYKKQQKSVKKRNITLNFEWLKV